MAFYRKSGGGNVAITTLKRRSGSTWVNVQTVKRRSGGTWVTVWTALTVAMSSTNGSTSFNPKVGTYVTTTPATATATPSGGSGYTYAWSFVSNPPGFTLSNASSQTVSVYCNPDAGPGTATLKCVVTATGGSTATGTVNVTLS